jgi:hypothetical protein
LLYCVEFLIYMFLCRDNILANSNALFQLNMRVTNITKLQRNPCLVSRLSAHDAKSDSKDSYNITHERTQISPREIALTNLPI